MRTIGISLAVVTMIAAVAMVRQAPAQSAQGGALTSAPPVKLYTSAADVVSLTARARSIRKDGEHNVVQPILQLAPYTTNLEYRASVGPATVHVHEAEIFFVVDGSATMVTGGKLVNPTQTSAENLGGTAIEGGTTRNIAKGDFIMVPENTPHWFSTINGTLVVMSQHLPRPLPSR